MKKERRVKKNYEFSSIISKRVCLKSQSFILYIDQAKENHSRVGISVGKKIGNAVSRTRVKRQLRVMINEVYNFNESFDSIIIVRPAFLKKDFSHLQEELKSLHDRAINRKRRKDPQ